jgi:hypothetical protein
MRFYKYVGLVLSGPDTLKRELQQCRGGVVVGLGRIRSDKPEAGLTTKALRAQRGPTARINLIIPAILPIPPERYVKEQTADTGPLSEANTAIIVLARPHPCPLPPGEGGWKGRRLELLAMAGDCKSITRRILAEEEKRRWFVTTYK